MLIKKFCVHTFPLHTSEPEDHNLYYALESV